MLCLGKPKRSLLAVDAVTWQLEGFDAQALYCLRSKGHLEQAIHRVRRQRLPGREVLSVVDVLGGFAYAAFGIWSAESSVEAGAV